MILASYKTLIEDIQPGETIRVDHDDCTAGADSRRRLYLTRPLSNPDRVIGYCHNCQKGGGLGDDKYETYRDSRHGPILTTTIVTDDIVLPPGIINKLNDWTVDAQSWAINNRIDQNDINMYDIGLDPTTGRVILPKYSYVMLERPAIGGVLEGYQARKVDNSKGPKYYTARRTEDKGYNTIYTKNVGVDLTVIVEDLVSGIHIARALSDHKVQIVVNYGTKVNLEALASFNDNYLRYVWLDNDSPHVKEQASIMARTLDLLNKGQTIVVEHLSDPKNHTRDEIRGILDCG